jgi:hypothetical protein
VPAQLAQQDDHMVIDDAVGILSGKQEHAADPCN